MSIKVEGLTKIYGEQKARDNVSFKINSGRIVGFIGPNGAGKTTTMKILTGTIPANSGKAYINNIDVAENSLEVRKKIGYLPEHNPLYSDMYIREYLNYVAGIYKIPNKKERIQEIIKLTGLSKEIRKQIGSLSKGYKQRVGLAQAIIHNPDVLILDEPTSGLDPNQIVEIRELISKLGKEKTVLLSTHIMQEVEAICDRVIVINKGNIVADDKASALSENTDSYLTIVVEFDKKIKPSSLREIKGITKVVNPEGSKYLVESKAGANVRPKIFQYAVKEKITVIEMSLKHKSMEEVFQELTK